jgi:hypothetical protein
VERRRQTIDRRSGSTEITQADFPAIIEAVRRKVFRVLGPGSDRPERDFPAAAGTDETNSNP